MGHVVRHDDGRHVLLRPLQYDVQPGHQRVVCIFSYLYGLDVFRLQFIHWSGHRRVGHVVGDKDEFYAWFRVKEAHA